MNDVEPPTVGPTGSPVVECRLSAESRNEEFHSLPPDPPGRVQYTYGNDDEIITERTLSDDEFAAATKAYELRSAEWKRTGGLHFVEHPPVYRCEVLCKDKTHAKGQLTGEGWQWTHWNS